MTINQMNVLARQISTIISMVFAAAIPMTASTALSAPSPACTSKAATAYPVFCQIPSQPQGYSSPEDYHAQVLDTRMLGARILASGAGGVFGLSDTEGFASDARALATPPVALTLATEAQTEAFVRAARLRATPPPRSR